MADERERAVAAWVAANDERAGATTSTLMDSKCLYLPIHGKDRVHGVAGILIADEGEIGSFEKTCSWPFWKRSGRPWSASDFSKRPRR